jgi:hypothetical protein
MDLDYILFDKDLSPSNKEINLYINTRPINKDLSPSDKDLSPSNKDLSPSNKEINLSINTQPINNATNLYKDSLMTASNFTYILSIICNFAFLSELILNSIVCSDCDINKSITLFDIYYGILIYYITYLIIFSASLFSLNNVNIIIKILWIIILFIFLYLINISEQLLKQKIMITYQIGALTMVFVQHFIIEYIIYR